MISYVFKASSLNIGNVIYNSTNKSITFNQAASSGITYAGSNHYITFLTYRAPPSTQPTRTIKFYVLSQSGYEKMSGAGTISAV